MSLGPESHTLSSQPSSSSALHFLSCFLSVVAFRNFLSEGRGKKEYLSMLQPKKNKDLQILGDHGSENKGKS